MATFDAPLADAVVMESRLSDMNVTYGARGGRNASAGMQRHAREVEQGAQNNAREHNAQKMSASTLATRALVDMMAFMQESYAANTYINDIIEAEYRRVQQYSAASRRSLYNAQMLYVQSTMTLNTLRRSVLVILLAILVSTLLSAILAAWRDEWIDNRSFVVSIAVVFALFIVALVVVIRSEVTPRAMDSRKWHDAPSSVEATMLEGGTGGGRSDDREKGRACFD